MIATDPDQTMMATIRSVLAIAAMALPRFTWR